MTPAPDAPQADGLSGALAEALHQAETSGGWWGHPECDEFARIVAPAVKRILLDRLAARDRDYEAEAQRRLIALVRKTADENRYARTKNDRQYATRLDELADRMARTYGATS